MLVYPNPYAHLDHKGRLAGVCPKGQPMYAAGQLPKREWIGAELDREHAQKTYNPGDEGQLISPSSDTRFSFESAAVFVEETPELRAYYKHAIDSGCLFQVAKREDVPLEQLAKARAKAIADWCANYGEAPDDAEWSKQFPLDEKIKAPPAPAPVEKPKPAPVAPKES